MEKVSIKAFNVELGVDKSAIIVDLADLDGSTYEGMELFRGTVLSKAVNTHSLYFSDGAMRQVRDELDDGRGVFTNHNISAENRIGRTLKANFRNGEVKSTFGIIPGLQAANSDDIIKISQIAGNEMSIAFYPEEDGIECDVCRLGMKPYWGGYIWMCDNYHMLGERYEDGDGVRRVLGEVVDVDRVSELSVVGNGSDPNTDIVKQITQDAELNVSLGVMNAMAEINNLDFRQLSHQLSSHQKNFGAQPDLKRIVDLGANKMSIPGTGDPNDGLQMSNEDLLNQLKQKQAEIADLKKQLEDAQASALPEDQRQALAAKITQLETDLEAEREKTKELDALKAVVEGELTHWRQAAISNKKKQMAYSENDPRLISYSEWANGCDDVARLRIDAMTSLGAYATTCLETPEMNIETDSDQPRVGSGYTN